MKFFIILIFMIFAHIVDDYYLQGWLASAKQKKWWKENAPQEKYKYDYIWVLIMHSFSWAFMIMLPILIYSNFNVTFVYVILLFANIIIHAVTDDLKANKFKINLWQDQIIHIWQIILTACVLIGKQ